MSSRTASLFDNPLDDPADYRTFTHAPGPAIVAPGPRWFVRCTDCLTIAAVTDDPTRTPLQCSICEGAIESMGKVQRDRLVHESHTTPCDHRCTDARGPICMCSCGGRNHGKAITVYIVKDAGKVPVVQMPNPDKATRQAAEYRALRDRLRAAFMPIVERRQAGAFLPRADFDRLNALQAAYRKAHKARDHKARIRTLTAALGA